MANQMERDEGGMHIWLSLVAFMCLLWAPSHLSSSVDFGTIILYQTMTSPDVE